MIYLDNAATTYPKPEEVYQAMDRVNREMAVNAGRGSYALAREATKLIDETKNMLLKLVKAEGVGKVVFTPSITIALNEILQGIDFQKGDNLYVSPYEHNAVARVAHLLQERKGVNVILMPLIAETLEIDLNKLQYMFSQNKPKAVCCVHVSNVTGYLLPVAAIFGLSKKYKAITILDSAQSLGLVEIDSLKMDLDFLAFAGHKTLYGPFGIGGFIDLNDVELKSFIAGGTGSNSLKLEMPEKSPYKFESSSLNIVAVAGLNAALKMIDIDRTTEKEQELLRYLIAQMNKLPSVVMYLPFEENHRSILSFNVEGYKADEIGEILDSDFDIAVRTGYHCAPFIHDCIGDGSFSGTIRVGIGQFTTVSEIDALILALQEIIDNE